MVEMVEKVARAVGEALAAQEEAFRDARVYEHGGKLWIDHDGSIDLGDLARAAIEAMREPTEAMTAAAEEEGTVVGCCNITADPAREIWGHMIDAALAEQKTPA